MSTDNSLLTPLHREYFEEQDGSRDDDGKLRQRIRDRVRLGLHDFPVLNKYARDTDIEQIFYRKDDTHYKNGNQVLPDKRNIMVQAHWVPVRHMIAFAWRGLRANGMDKQEIFDRVVVPAIEEGEAKHKNISRGNIESDISLDTLQVHRQLSQIDPVEKFERGLSLKPEEWKELHNQLNQEIDRDFRGENLTELIEENLID